MHNFNHIHHVSGNYLKDFHQTYSPVFILNTGRSGSAFIQNVFSRFPSLDAHHEAFPNLFLYSNFAFHNQENSETLQHIFNAARIELLLKAKVSGKIYLESNQCLVFYIYQIKQLFPNAKFVHLTRHPGDFVRSAIMKGWHKNDSVWEKGRIRVADDEQWLKMNQIERLGWVWKETHNFIEKFKEQYPSNCYTLRLEDLVNSSNELVKLLDFIEVENNFKVKDLNNFLSKKVNKISISKNEPANMFKLNSYPKYNNWTNEDKNYLHSHVSDLSEKYSYTI